MGKFSVSKIAKKSGGKLWENLHRERWVFVGEKRCLNYRNFVGANGEILILLGYAFIDYQIVRYENCRFWAINFRVPSAPVCALL